MMKPILKKPLFTPRPLRRRLAGVSLPEVLVVLLVAGIATVVVGQLVARNATQISPGSEPAILDDATHALIGFAKVNLLLPKPQAGMLPPSLASNIPGNGVRYFVAPTLLDAPAVSFDPHGLLSRNAGSAPDALDYCRKIALTPLGDLIQVGSGADAQPAVFAVEYSTSGQTAAASEDVAVPGSSLDPQRATQGRFSKALGRDEFFAALGCPDRVARTAAAAKYQWAMKDMLDIAESNTTLKHHDMDVGIAGNGAAKLGMAQLIVVMVALGMDQAENLLELEATMPEADYPTHILLGAMFTGFMAITAANIAIVQQHLDDWGSKDQPMLQQEINTALEKQEQVRQALEDARFENEHYHQLGFRQ